MEVDRTTGVLVYLLVVVLVTVGFVFGGVAMKDKMTEDPGERHETFITFENEAANETYGEIYVMDGGQWDLLPVTVDSNSSTTVRIEWYGDYETVTIFAVFNYNSYETVFRYEVRENEYRTVFLI